MTGTCRDVRDALSRFLDGESPAGEAARVRAHAASCAACRAELDALERTHAATRRAFAKHPFDAALARRIAAAAANASARPGEGAGARGRVIPGPWAAARRAAPRAAAAAALLAVGLGAWLVLRGGPGAGPGGAAAAIASVRAVEGGRLVVARGGGLGDVTTVAPGETVELRAGDRVAVDRREGEILFPDATRVLVRPDTRVRVDESAVAIEGGPGELFCQVRPRPAGAPSFRVETPAASAEVLGTSFGVRYEGGAAVVTVLEGRVRVVPHAGPPGALAVVVARDERARAPEGGAPSLERVAARRELAWALGRAAAPPPPVRPDAVPSGGRPGGDPASPEETPASPGIDLPVGGDRPRPDERGE